MPYASNAELPKPVRDALPEAAQSTWRKIVNAALETYDGDDAKAAATAWAGLKNAGWHKDGETWVKKAAPPEVAWAVEVRKLDPEKRRVFGYALISKTSDGDEVSDLQGDYAPPDEMEEAAYDFVKHARVGGEMHEGPAPAVLIESMAFTPEKCAALGIPEGLLPTAHFVGFEVPPETFERVKAGQRAMFSVQGEAERVPMMAGAA